MCCLKLHFGVCGPVTQIAHTKTILKLEGMCNVSTWKARQKTILRHERNKRHDCKTDLKISINRRHRVHHQHVYTDYTVYAQTHSRITMSTQICWHWKCTNKPRKKVRRKSDMATCAELCNRQKYQRRAKTGIPGTSHGRRLIRLIRGNAALPGF